MSKTWIPAPKYFMPLEVITYPGGPNKYAVAVLRAGQGRAEALSGLALWSQVVYCDPAADLPQWKIDQVREHAQNWAKKYRDIHWERKNLLEN